MQVSMFNVKMHFVIILCLLASLTFISTSQQQTNGKPSIANNNPYLWMLSNQLFHMNTEINGLKQNMKTCSGLQKRMSSLESIISSLAETNRQQKQQMKKMAENIKKQEFSLTKMEQNCSCKYSKECQSGWELYNKHCYYFGTNATWQEAKNYEADTNKTKMDKIVIIFLKSKNESVSFIKERCEALGSHLAKIETKAEHDWIMSNSTRTVNTPWIGLNDIKVEGQWRWVSDNSLMTFNAWHPKQPDNWGNIEHCGHYAGQFWNDYPCHSRQGFICEKT